MIKIAPSLLSADFLNLEAEIKRIEDAKADLLHLDIMDGHFVPNLTFGPPLIERIAAVTSLPLDVHFMVTNPGDYAKFCIEHGIAYVSFHQETVLHLHRELHVLKDAGVKTGIALNPGTSVNVLLPILRDLDFVLLMSVNPGFGGQKFLPLVYEKIRRLKALAVEYDLCFEIEVDGGVNNANAGQLQREGASILVAGNYIFNGDYAANMRRLRQCSDN